MKPRNIIILASILLLGISLYGQNPGYEPPAGPIYTVVKEHWKGQEDFPTLVKNSDLIVKGKIIQSQSIKELSGLRAVEQIFTDSKVEITAIYKDELGINPASIAVRQIGGTFESQEVTNANNPAFKVGEEYILMLNPCKGRDNLELWCVARSMGRFYLDKGKAYYQYQSFQEKNTASGLKDNVKAQGYPLETTEIELTRKIESLIVSKPK